MLPININRNPYILYMGSPKTLSHLTLSDLKFQSQGHSDFESIISRKGAMLVYMLLFSINRKAYVGNPFVQLHLP